MMFKLVALLATDETSISHVGFSSPLLVAKFAKGIDNDTKDDIQTNRGEDDEEWNAKGNADSETPKGSIVTVDVDQTAWSCSDAFKKVTNNTVTENGEAALHERRTKGSSVGVKHVTKEGKCYQGIDVDENQAQNGDP